MEKPSNIIEINSATSFRLNDNTMQMIKAVFSSIKGLYSPEMQKTIQYIAHIGKNVIDKISSAISFIQSIDFERIQQAVNILREGLSYAEDYESLIDNCMDIVYNYYNWCPSIVYTFLNDMQAKSFFELIDIIDSCRLGSDNSKNKIDKIVFKYYSNSKIEVIKRICRHSSNLSVCYKKLIIEALTAYQNKNYGSTVIILSMLLQGIISNKASNRMYQQDDKIKKCVKDLVAENKRSEAFTEFFNNCIYKPCSNCDDVNVDVLSRHAVAHGWMQNYPSKKAALNAILFTEFLLNLQPINKEN